MEKDYICGCGKAYGSYPAFSTHRKTKHRNITMPGTIIPTQEKAKRGRPSCDFKKIPDIDDNKKEFYQGLNIIEYGLLDLEQKYKGKILSQASQSNESKLQDIDSEYPQDNPHIKNFQTFTKLLTTHMQAQTSQSTSFFLRDLVRYGIQTGQLGTLQLFNNYCVNNYRNLINSELGAGYYLEVCLLVSKWMCVMGYSREILRCRVQGSNNADGKGIERDNKAVQARN